MKLGMLALAATMAGTTLGAVAAPRGVTVEDLVAMERVGSPAVSPDGSRVAYTVRTTDMGKNRGHTEVYVVDLRAANPTPQRLTSDAASSTDPEWSPNGDAVYFLSSRSGSGQVWRVPATGGDAVRVTDLPLDVDAFRVAPAGDRMLLSMAVFRDCADLACTKARLDAKEKDKASGKIYDRLFVRHWDTWSDGRNNVLYAAPLDASGRVNGTPVSLSGSLDGDVPSKPFGDREEFRFSPDGKTVVFSVRIAGKTEAWSTNFDLYTVPATGGTPRNLTADNHAWDTKGVFSPDGRTLAYLAMSRPGFEADRYHIVLLDLASGKKRNVAESWDRSPGGLQWTADGKTLVADAEDVGQHRLFAIDVASGKVSPLTDKGSIGGFDVRGNTVAYTQANLASGAQLFGMRLGADKPVQLTHVNEAKLADVRWGEYEQFSFKGANGDTVYGHVMKPWNYEPGKSYPIAFLVHGGPQGSFGNGWSYRWNPQVYAGAGYATVFIDFHGSTGYGQKFTDAIFGVQDGKEAEDVLQGVDAALAKHSFLDASRLGVEGGSYGGQLTDWLVTRTNRFKAAIPAAGIANLVSFNYMSYYHDYLAVEFGRYPQEKGLMDTLWARSALRYVSNVKTPVMFIHGENDNDVPIAEAEQYYIALRDVGVPTVMVRYPREGHGLRETAHIADSINRSIAWYDRWFATGNAVP